MATSINSNNQAPWYLDPNDCIGDSLGYINQNAAYVNNLPTTANVNTLTTNFNTLSTNAPVFIRQTSNLPSAITNTYANVFSTSPIGDYLLPNSVYEIVYDVYAATASTGTLTFQISGDSSNISSALLTLLHTTDFTANPTVNVRGGGNQVTSSTNIISLAANTAACIANKIAYFNIRTIIQTGTSGIRVNLQTKTSIVTTTFTTQANSYRKVTKIS
jgi:hypothetical protein